METATSCTKYSQVAGLVHMLGEDCTMMSSFNVGFNYMKILLKIKKNQLFMSKIPLCLVICQSYIQCIHGRECCQACVGSKSFRTLLATVVKTK